MIKLEARKPLSLCTYWGLVVRWERLREPCHARVRTLWASCSAAGMSVTLRMPKAMVYESSESASHGICSASATSQCNPGSDPAPQMQQLSKDPYIPERRLRCQPSRAAVVYDMLRCVACRLKQEKALWEALDWKQAVPRTKAAP